MFVSEKVIFLQLQKTAGTHIAALLEEHLGGKQDGKHGPLYFDPAGKLVVGSVRDPWDWYVSLFAYGCSTNGGLQGLLKRSRVETSRRIVGVAAKSPSLWKGAAMDLMWHAHRDPAFWRACYADPHDHVAFRRWLKALMSQDGRKLLGYDYAGRPLSRFSGFYTYRFMSIFVPRDVWTANASGIAKKEDLDPFFAKHGAVDVFVRTEHVEDDLAAVFERIGRPDVTSGVLQGDRINASKRSKVEHYYDAETAALVADADSFVIKNFGYEHPNLQSKAG